MYIALSGSLALSALLLLSAPAQAAENGDSPALIACIKKSAGVTSDMVECMGRETKAQDARLNAAYKGAMASMDAEHKQGLQEVQRRWIDYRDANCGFLGDLTGGTIDRFNSTSCFLDMTRTRAQELEGLIDP